MSTLITAKNISIIRNQTPLLDNISLEIKPKEFITLVGPNGAGKSILLKCLLGIITPDTGQIKRKKNLKIGYMPQSLTFNTTLPMPVLDFLNLNNETIKINFDAIIQETKIEHLLMKQLHELSGGEIQNIIFTRALLNNPDILIMDEPAQNLDIGGQLSFYKTLNEVYEKHNFAILMVSHDLHLVLASTQKVLCLYRHICCAGSPKTITSHPEFISLFGEDMAKMMAIYSHHHNHDHIH